MTEQISLIKDSTEYVCYAINNGNVFKCIIKLSEKI